LQNNKIKEREWCYSRSHEKRRDITTDESGDSSKSGLQMKQVTYKYNVITPYGGKHEVKVHETRQL